MTDVFFRWRLPAWVEPALMLGTVAAAVISAAQGGGGVGFVAASLAGFGVMGLAWARGTVSLRTVVAVGVLARLIAFPLSPVLSDDGYRYVWDGLLQLRGVNPYRLLPSDPALVGMQAGELFDRLNSAGYYSVYPPASQLVFLLGCLLGAGGWLAKWYAVKGLFLLLELGGLAALARMVPPRLLVLYAWHPLVIVELAGQGHTEAGMVAGLLVGVWAYERKRPGLAVAAVTVAGWFKLVPLVLLPFVLRRVGRRYAVIATITTGAVWAPYWAPYVVSHLQSSLDLYVRLFEFNAGPYYLAKLAGYAVAGEDLSKTLGPAFAGVFLFGLAAIWFVDRRKRLPLAWAAVLPLGLFLATATTVHPWYLVGVLALLPLALVGAGAAGRLHAAAWLSLSAGAPATYLFYEGHVTVYWIAVIATWTTWGGLMAAAGAVLLLPHLLRRRARTKWRWMAPHAGTPRRLLDLGAGEGFVGEAAADATEAEVLLYDVVDFNRSRLTLHRYDGRTLLLEADAVDVTLLSFVLHHAADPEQVLREARRVTRGHVLVLESVVETRWDRWWLPRADRVANRLRSGGRMRAQEEHLCFRSASGWAELAEQTRLRVIRVERRGGVLHRQALLVLEPM